MVSHIQWFSFMKRFINRVNACKLLLVQPAIPCSLREKWMLSVTVIVAMFILWTSSLMSVGCFCLLSFKRHVDAFYPMYVHLLRELKDWLGRSQKCLPSWIGLSRYRRYIKHQNSRSSAKSLWVPHIMSSYRPAVVFLSINQLHIALDFWILHCHLTGWLVNL
jgi:hypothetical protein